MSFDRGYEHLSRRCIGLPMFFSHHGDHLNFFNYYHVVIHKSQLETFGTNTGCISISKLWNNEHVHLIAYSERLLKNRAGIRLEEIEFSNRLPYELSKSKLKSKLYYIAEHFIFCQEEQHDFFCKVTFNVFLLDNIYNDTFIVSSLKNECIAFILKNLNYLHDMEKLKLPKSLLRDIFRISKSHFRLPEFDGQNRVERVIAKDIKVFETFTKHDIVFNKKFVGYFQNMDSDSICIELENLHIVFAYFKTVNDDKINMCLRCMRFENENGYFKRMFAVLDCCNSSNYKFIKDPINWCRACQQVPLFQLLTFAQFNKLYTCHLNIREWIKYFGVCNGETLIKIDYFEKGDKVKSLRCV